MKKQTGGAKGWRGLLATLSVVMLIQGCSTRNNTVIDADLRPVSEVEQGLLGDLNRYVWQLAGQQTAGNAQAGSILVRLMNGRGLPEPVRLSEPVRDKQGDKK